MLLNEFNNIASHPEKIKTMLEKIRARVYCIFYQCYEGGTASIRSGVRGFLLKEVIMANREMPFESGQGGYPLPCLEPGFHPLVLARRFFRAAVRASGRAVPLKLAVATPSYPEVVATGTTDWNAVDQTKLQYFVDKDRAALVGGTTRDREWLRRQNVEPWRKLADQGVGVMVGEFGSFNKTPHKIALAWLEDMLANWREQNWGWALWNFRGSFGIADSGRVDVDYEDWRGLKLDREMLSLLQRY